MNLIDFKSGFCLIIQINKQTRCNSFTSLLLDVYVWLNMFRAPLCASSGAYNRTSNAATATLQRKNQRLLVRLYAPDDAQKGARNMLSHT
jgi:hypothetical protein